MIKTVSVEEYTRLKQIAALSALMYIETKYLVDLAIAVETHMAVQSIDSAKVIEQAYFECSARTKHRFQLELALEALLIQNNDLRLVVPEDPTSEDNEPSAIPANVISIFKTKS